MFEMRVGRGNGEARKDSRDDSLIGNVHNDIEAKVFSRVLLVVTEGW